MYSRPSTAAGPARFNDIKAEWNAATRCVSPADARLHVHASTAGRPRPAFLPTVRGAVHRLDVP